MKSLKTLSINITKLKTILKSTVDFHQIQNQNKFSLHLISLTFAKKKVITFIILLIKDITALITGK